MDVTLARIKHINNNELQITGSKSETNRLLILQALHQQISIANISNSDDAEVMQKALASNEKSY